MAHQLNDERVRDHRQITVADWCERAFGKEQAASVQQRCLRLLEESIEAYQAVGCDEQTAIDLVRYVFSRPKGELRQEIGGIGLVLLSVAQAAGLSAEAEECREIDRVLAKPLEHFTKRNQEKNDAGFLVTGLEEK